MKNLANKIFTSKWPKNDNNDQEMFAFLFDSTYFLKAFLMLGK